MQKFFYASIDISTTGCLQELDLSFNDLATLPPEVKDILPHLTLLNLEGNPWLCDRSLLWLKQWMQEESVSFYVTNPPTCDEPFNLKGREISQIADDQFAEVSVVNTPSQQPPAQNSRGLTEELASPVGQAPERPENMGGSTEQPPQNDQGRLYQVIGGQMNQRPKQSLSQATSRGNGQSHGSGHAGEAKALAVDNQPQSFKAVRPDQGSTATAMGNTRSNLTIQQANHPHHLKKALKTAPDASQLSNNDAKTSGENSTSSEALVIKRPDQEVGREAESKTAKTGSLTAHGDHSGARAVQGEQNTIARTKPQKATPPQPNSKKARRQNGRRRRGRGRGRGRGRKRARKGKGSKGRKNRRQRKNRKQRHDRERGQRKNLGNFAP